MGVRMLVGEADGGRKAAAMYDSSSGWMVGPLFESEDADEQIDAFVQWLSEHGAGLREKLALQDAPRGILGMDGRDPRHWLDPELERIVKHWRSLFVGDDGWLMDVYECGCGSGHHHLGESGETARHGECVYARSENNPCGCRTWRPGNEAARRAAEGE